MIEWEKIKPVQGRIKPTVAINSLAIFEGQVNRLSAEHDHICNAKEGKKSVGVVCLNLKKN